MVEKLLNDRRLASVALAHWGLADAQIEHSGAGGDYSNRLLFVDVDEQRFTIRLYSPETDRGKIRSMLFWLASLRQEAGLRVLEPVLTLDGELIAGVTVEGLPPRYCVLYRWLEGRMLSDYQQENSVTLQMVENFGAFVAKIHANASSIEVPEWFVPNRDAEFLRIRKIAPRTLARLRSEGEDSRTKATAVENALQVFDELGDAREGFGLVHGALDNLNVLFHGEQVSAIDFTTSHYGYYLNEIVKTLWMVLQQKVVQ